MSVSRAIPILRPENQPYVTHAGNHAGIACTFELASPPRTKCIPYAYLQCIDTDGEKSIILRYTFADVELTLGRAFTARRQLLEELANFRVASIPAGDQIGIRILMEPLSEKSEIF
ncbi:MAG TPA: hypothetical protein VN957_03730 [Chthoniobacterales bacterium]|jgi:hypothetical protein|nr:hypothetical protein [Chthoniobacterales bacterium]